MELGIRGSRVFDILIRKIHFLVAKFIQKSRFYLKNKKSRNFLEQNLNIVVSVVLFYDANGF